MSNQTIAVIGELLGAFFVGLVLAITPKLRAWLTTHASKAEQERIKILIDSFVQAAEQLLYDKDDDGTMRMDYVKNQLTALGIGLTADVVSMIEGAVWEVNNQNRQAKGMVQRNGNG